LKDALQLLTSKSMPLTLFKLRPDKTEGHDLFIFSKKEKDFFYFAASFEILKLEASSFNTLKIQDMHLYDICLEKVNLSDHVILIRKNNNNYSVTL
jgi:hypothetical protein